MNEAAQRQKHHYQKIAETYVENRRQSVAYSLFLDVWSERLLDPWLRNVVPSVRREQVVVDPMCGHANLAPYILQHTNHLYLNDISPSMLAYIPPAIRARSTILPPSDISTLPLDDDSVDVVVISGGLHHMHNHLGAVLTECWRVLRAKGLLLFGEPSNEFLPVRVLRNLIYQFNGNFDHATERAFRHDEIRQALRHTEFCNVQLRPFGSIGYLLMAQVGVVPLLRSVQNRNLLRALQAIDRAIEHNRFLRQSCFAFTGEAVKPEA